MTTPLIVSDTEYIRRLRPNGPFSLAAALDFLAGFAPAGAGEQDGAYRGAHVLAGEPALVEVQAAGDELAVSSSAAEPEAVALVRRMLSLDLDGAAFYEHTGAHDPVLGAVQRRHPGLRPVLFATPWEALCWTLIGHRISMVQASRLKDRVRDRYGPQVEGRRAFPAPAALLELDPAEAGLPAVKAERLRALAARGVAGELEADALAAMEPAEALAWLERSPGIGRWSSAFCLIRGVGFPDLLPTGERRLDAAVAAAYGVTSADAVTDGWAPFRAWAAFLFRVDAGG